MKTRSLAAALLLSLPFDLVAAESQPAKPGSAAFEKMKTLAGKWTGKMDMGAGPVDFEMQYRLIAGGSVLEERVLAGTPQEMVTMYYDQGGKLAMTHYCMFGNCPTMRLKSSDAKTIESNFDPISGIDAKKESHMHALTLKFVNADTIEPSCQAIIAGKEAPKQPAMLKRVNRPAPKAKARQPTCASRLVN